MFRSIFRLTIITATLALLAATPALAQQIEGQVRYAQGGDPVYNATVRCDGLGCSERVYTDRNGKFRFRFRRPGQYTITVEAEGYLPEQRFFSLLAYSASEYMDVRLRPDPSKTRNDAAAPPGVIDVRVPLEARKEFDRASLALGDPERIEEGIAHLEKAIRLYPKFLEAHLLLANAYLELDQLDKAEAALRAALKINSKSAEAHFLLGDTYRQQKKYAEAEKVLLAGLKLSDSWRGHIALGRLYWDMGDHLKAGPEVGKALKLKPNLAEGHLLAGNILLKSHQPEDALKEYEEYLRLEPKGKFATQAQDVVDKIKKALAEKKK
jgi:tetratricopeptide (TPR) repeat protein